MPLFLTRFCVRVDTSPRSLSRVALTEFTSESLGVCENTEACGWCHGEEGEVPGVGVLEALEGRLRLVDPERLRLPSIVMGF